jgi:hypothetical protein
VSLCVSALSAHAYPHFSHHKIHFGPKEEKNSSHSGIEIKQWSPTLQERHKPKRQKKNPSRLHLHHQYVVPRLQNLPDFSEIQQKQTGPAQSEISKSGKIQSEFGSNSVKISRFGRLRIFSQGRIFEPSVVSLTVASLQKMKTQTPACRLVIKQRQQQPRHFHPTANDTSHLPSTHAPPSVSAVDQVRYPLVIPCNICCLIAADRGYRGGG